MSELQTLENGIPLIYTFRNQKTGHLVIHFNNGSSSDFENLQGIVHLLEHMLFKGTKKRNYLDLICGIEHLGADVNAFTTKENMVIHVSYPDEFLNEICEIIADIIYNSVFDEKELKKEKLVICDEIRSYRDTPEEFIYDEWERLMLNGNDLSHPILGNTASVKRVTVNDLKNIYKLVCNDFHISIISKRSKNDVFEIISKYFSKKINSKTKPVIDKPLLNNVKKQKKIYEDVSQTHVILGGYGPHITHKDYLPAHVLSTFFGGSGMSSLLNMELREKKGISYSVETFCQSYRDYGLFSTYFTCDRKRVDHALKIIKKIFSKYRECGLSEKELETILRINKSQYVMFFENALNEAIYQAKYFQYNKKIIQIKQIFEMLDSIDLPLINKVAAQLLDFEKYGLITIEKNEYSK